MERGAELCEGGTGRETNHLPLHGKAQAHFEGEEGGEGHTDVSAKETSVESEFGRKGVFSLGFTEKEREARPPLSLYQEKRGKTRQRPLKWKTGLRRVVKL